MKTVSLILASTLLLTGCMTDPSKEAPSDVFAGGTDYNLTPARSVAPAPVPAAAPISQPKPVMTKPPKMVKEVEVVVQTKPDPQPVKPSIVSTGDSFTVAIPKGERRATQMIDRCAAALEVNNYEFSTPNQRNADGLKTIRVSRAEGMSVDEFNRFENCILNLMGSAEQSAALRNTPANQPL